MNKYIYLLVLFPLIIFAKTNFNKGVIDLDSSIGYSNFSQNIFQSNLVSGGSTTTVIGSISVNNNVLTFNITNYSTVYLNSVTINLTSLPNLPYIFLGNLATNSTTYANYHASVNGNNLYLGYSSVPFTINNGINFSFTQCLTNWYRDADGDTYGSSVLSATNPLIQCTQPIGYVLNNTDCDDTNGLYHNTAIWYTDNDHDGFGSVAIAGVTQCLPIANGVLINGDCDDTKKEINPNTKWYIDSDNDGFGENSASTVTACVKPTGNYVLNNLDNCPGIAGTIQGCIVPVVTASNVAGSFGNDMNFILSSKPKIATTNLQTLTDSKDVNVSITYFDGLGRPIQNIANKQSNSGKDIVTPIEYDTFGRQTKEYLPYASTQNTLAYITGTAALTNQAAYYNTTAYGNTTNPFSEKQLEASPLNRILQQAAPGNDWEMSLNHTIKLDYQTNSANEVKLYSVISNWDGTKGLYNIPTSLTATNYAANQLYKTITKDENWKSTDVNNNTTEEFKDKEGHIVLKRTYDNGVAHETYYLYDQFGNLTFVLPPLVNTANTITTTVLDGLCYQYKYDYRNRLVEKKLPGKQWEFIVYDKLDRVVATGPAFSPFTDQQTTQPTTPIVGWMITRYDAFSRPVYTGWQQITSTYDNRKNKQDNMNLQTVFNETKSATVVTIDGVATNYTNTINPPVFKLLTVNYYDDYSFPNPPTATQLATTGVYYNNTSQKPKGLPTGSWVRALSTLTDATGENSYILYDYKARPIRTYTQNHLGGYTQVDSSIDFAGKTLFTETRHKRSNVATDTEIYVKDAFTYSDQDRLLTHTHQIGTTGPIELLASNTYDELGQLISKKVGNTETNPLQKVDYAYNIRGWLKSINDISNLTQGTDPQDLFAFKLNYQDNIADASLTFNAPSMYNGNISETLWKTRSDNQIRKYGYQYDNLNRLRNAVYQKPESNTKIRNSYNESLNYDKNGNITFLNRKGNLDVIGATIDIDNLNYSYNSNSNQLTNVADTTNSTEGFKDVTGTTDDYAYDANGNMIRDNNKTITSIKYNHLNLPTEILFANTNTKITYLYNAIGTKLSKAVKTSAVITKTTDYLNGFQYIRSNAAASRLQFFPTAEGYVSVTGTSPAYVFNYVYNYTDHLGNVRLSYTKDTTVPSGISILEENNYYPFGLKHTNYNADILAFVPAGTTVVVKPVTTGGVANATPINNYKYNGKELQDELGLNVYDYGARIYTPDAPHFWQIDPLAEKSSRWSPYSYCLDNPVNMIDPDGRDPITRINTSSNYTLTYNGKNNYTLTNVSTTNLTTTNEDGSSTTNTTSKTTNINYTMSEDKDKNAVLTVTGGSVNVKATQTVNSTEPYNGVVNGSGRTSVTNTIVDITKPMNAAKASSTMNGDKNLSFIGKALQSYHQVNGANHSIFMDPKDSGVNPWVPVISSGFFQSISAKLPVGNKANWTGIAASAILVGVDQYYKGDNERSKGRTAVINPSDDK
jgi:RHS repeat-associated protein